MHVEYASTVSSPDAGQQSRAGAGMSIVKYSMYLPSAKKRDGKRDTVEDPKTLTKKRKVYKNKEKEKERMRQMSPVSKRDQSRCTSDLGTLHVGEDESRTLPAMSPHRPGSWREAVTSRAEAGSLCSAYWLSTDQVSTYKVVVDESCYCSFPLYYSHTPFGCSCHPHASQIVRDCEALSRSGDMPCMPCWPVPETPKKMG